MGTFQNIYIKTGLFRDPGLGCRYKQIQNVAKQHFGFFVLEKKPKRAELFF
jgi:hypothetical protein